MKKGQVYEGVIESVEFPNKGIVNVSQEDRRVIVKNGVPGQKVRFSVNKVKKGKAEGRTEHLKQQVQKKLAKGKSIEVIADELEESVSAIENVLEELRKNA